MLTDEQIKRIMDRWEVNDSHLPISDLEALVKTNGEAVRLRVALLSLLEWAERAELELIGGRQDIRGLPAFGGYPPYAEPIRAANKILNEKISG